jgi:tripartite-type tricarboxylate transporter receptor subunit TctC
MKLSLLATACALAISTLAANADSYPSRPITIVGPFPAGGPGDTFMRAISERMRASLGQPLVIENVTGASGSIGTGRVARAAGDGYTIGIGGFPAHVINPAIMALQYDVIKDFEPIALLATSPLLIVAKKSVPANDLKELVAWLKATPDKASAGTGGVGSPQHLASIYFQKETATRFGLVPYRGGISALPDLLSGQLDLMIDVPSSSLPHVRAGTLKAFGVTAKSRLKVAADIPTVDEAGLPGFYIGNWIALFAPKSTPRPIIEKLNAAVVHALADPGVRSRLAELAFEIPSRELQTPEALSAFHKAEIDKWWPIIKTAGIKAE